MKLDTSDPDFKWAEILTPLDDVLIDDTLKKRLQFWYSVRLSDNSLGYALAAYFDEIKYE